MEGSVKRGESVMGSHVGPQARGVNKRQMKEKNGADTQRRAELKGITLNLIDGEKGPAPRLSRSIRLPIVILKIIKLFIIALAVSQTALVNSLCGFTESS